MSDSSGTTNAPEEARARNGQAPVVAERELSLIDLTLSLVRSRRLIAYITLAMGGAGVLLALFSPVEYTAQTRIVREAQATEDAGRLGGGLAALRGFGINLGGASVGLSAEAYPDVIKSREVRLAVARESYYIAESDSSLTFVAYANRAVGPLGAIVDNIKYYTIGWLRALLTSGSPAPSDEQKRYPTEEEEEAIRQLGEMVSASADEITGLMSVSVVTGEPRLSAELAASFSRHLAERVRSIQTQKAYETLQFMRERFAEVGGELRVAEERLADFIDRNGNPQSAQLRTELDRLRRQVRFKEELYSELQAQVTQAQIDLQRSQPVVTVIEKPVPPMLPSAPSRTLLVVVFIILGATIGVGVALVRDAMLGEREDAEQAAKLEEIRQALVPERMKHYLDARWPSA